MTKKLTFYSLVLTLSVFSVLLPNYSKFNASIIHTFYLFLMGSMVFFEYQNYSIINRKIPFFLNPPTIYSLYTILKIGLGGYLTLFSKSNWIYYNYNSSSFILADFISILSVVFIYFGFSLKINSNNKHKQYKHIKIPKKRTVYYFTAIPVLATIIGLRLGTYGYLGESTNNSLLYIQFLKMFAGLSSFLIIFTTYYFYNTKQEKLYVHLLVILFFIVGLFYGHKSTAVIIVLNFAIAIFYKRHKLNKKLWYIIVISIFIAYIIIQPIRAYIQYHNQIKGTSLTVSDAYNIYKYSRNAPSQFNISNGGFVFDSFLSRNNYMVPLSMAIESKNTLFVEKHIKGGWMDIFLSPFYALVPRFIWKNKPMANLGKYFSVEVYGSKITTSIGFTPQGYLYLLSGIWGVVFGFLLIGLFQKVITQFLIFRIDNPIIYLSILLGFSYPTDLLWSYFSGVIQVVFFYYIISVFLFKRKNLVISGEILNTK